MYYPLVPPYTSTLDELANLVGGSRESTVVFALVLVGVVAGYAVRQQTDSAIDRFDVVLWEVGGERLLDGAFHKPLSPTTGAVDRVAIHYPPSVDWGELAPPWDVMARWFECDVHTIPTHAVAWILAVARRVLRGGELRIRCSLGTEFVLYSEEQHTALSARLEPMLDKWKGRGGVVRVEGRWDVTI
jgi:hypothetical protein